MREVTIRELRSRGGEVIDGVAAGDAVVVTRSGTPVAELRPLPRRPLPLATLLERRRGLAATDPRALRRDVDGVVDQRL